MTPQKYRNITALIWSTIFYAWGAPKFIFILFGSIVVDFFLVKKINQSNDFIKKKYLWVSMILNVGLLLYFKYANFFIENTNTLLEGLGMSAIHWTKLALPIGISFFTFQKISYVIDVYRGKNKPLEKLSDLALYIILFPQLIAGPIVRYSEIKEQLQNRWTNENVDNRLNGFFRFSIGLAKKMLIANQMSELANAIFSLPAETLTMGQAWLGALAYAFQIYFDFSGYSDMAIGLGLMMGFRFPENFNAPYIAQNITEFWRRWHITLSNWMRDYLYIPLGGNRVNSKARLYFNLSVVFLISGFWHGAAWTFIAWGAFHGLFLILDRLFLLRVYRVIGKPLSIMVTFIITLVGWVIFRAETFPQALSYIATMFDWSNIDLTVSITKGTYGWFIEKRFWIIIMIASFFSFLPAITFVERNMNPFFGTQGEKDFILIKSIIAFILLYVSMTEVISTGVNPFIYYRF